MGGPGSGRLSGFRAATTNDYRSIDLAWLKKRGVLKTGYSGSLSWSRGGARIADITYEVREAGLSLTYRVTPRRGEAFAVDETIRFVWTEQPLGGRRRWFLCPSCRRRCRTLFGGAYFRCRRCHGLQHASKYEPDYDRAMEKANRLRQRLGDHQFTAFDFDELPPKPPRMRWTTYQRLEAEYAALQRRWKVGVIQRFGLGDLAKFGIRE